MAQTMSTLHERDDVCRAFSSQGGREGFLSIDDLHLSRGDTNASSATSQLTWYQSRIAFHSRINPDPSPITRGDGVHSSLLRSSNISVSAFTNISSLALIPHPSSHLSSLTSPLRSAHYAHLTSTRTVINQATIDAFNS